MPPPLLNCFVPFQEADEHGAVQVASVEVAGHTGVETAVVGLGFADNLHGAGLRGAGDGPCGQEAEEEVAQP